MLLTFIGSVCKSIIQTATTAIQLVDTWAVLRTVTARTLAKFMPTVSDFALPSSDWMQNLFEPCVKRLKFSVRLGPAHTFSAASCDRL